MHPPVDRLAYFPGQDIFRGRHKGYVTPEMGLSVSAELFGGVMGNEWIALAVFHGITSA